MVLFILTRAGFEEVKPLIVNRTGPVWVDAGILSPDEIAALRRDGVNLTTFSTPIDKDWPNGIGASLEIIREHHPSETIWVEFAPD